MMIHFLLMASLTLQPAVVAHVKGKLLERYGEQEKERIDQGVSQVVRFWQEKDGDAKALEDFCLTYFTPMEKLPQLYDRLSNAWESINGHFNKMILDLKRPLHLDWGPLFPLDELLGAYDPSAHLVDDLFDNKVAFVVLLNFPHYSLEEKLRLSRQWDRTQWAYARMGDLFQSRVPASLQQALSLAFTQGDTYIAQYNIYMGNLLDEKGHKLFPKDLKLISHWGLRDELKAQYAKKDGYPKQKIIYQVMLRIIQQEIPQKVINNPNYLWDPIHNRVYKDGKEIAFTPEPNTRYAHWLKIYQALKAVDPYYPNNPSYFDRKFSVEREIPYEKVKGLLTTPLESPQFKAVAKLIQKRLGRPLEPFDIWYDGFKPRAQFNEDELSTLTRKRYPTAEAFHKDIPRILKTLGFREAKAAFIAQHISVDPSRGAGHAWGPEMRGVKAHLRTRVGKEGMDYKGYNIAIHELGHCVEQVLSLYDIDHYILHGVPNTAFTEAFAFVFQNRDLELLGVYKEEKDTQAFKTLDRFWATCEIGGVGLVDMEVWKWLKDHPDTSVEAFKKAVITIAKDIWNRYYAPVFGVPDCPILAIYSHLVDSAMYVPDYPIGFLIQTQIEVFLKDKVLGKEMPRMCALGRIIPERWMEKAVGQPLSAQPLLEETTSALKQLGNEGGL